METFLQGPLKARVTRFKGQGQRRLALAEVHKINRELGGIQVWFSVNLPTWEGILPPEVGQEVILSHLEHKPSGAWWAERAHPCGHLPHLPRTKQDLVVVSSVSS